MPAIVSSGSVSPGSALAAILLFGILTLWVPGQWALSLFQVALFGLAAVRIGKKLRGSQSRSKSLTHGFFTHGFHPVIYWIGAIVLWGVLQLVFHRSIDGAVTQEAVLNWAANGAAFALALDCFEDTTTRERFLRAATYVALVLAVTGVFTVLTSPPGKVIWVFDVGTDLPTVGPFVYRNQYAAFVEAVLPLGVVRALRERGRRIQDMLIVATLFGSVVAAGSRTGTILCTAEILVLPLIAYLRRFISLRSGVQAILGSVAAMAILIGVVGWQSIWNRLQEPNPYALRQDLVRSSLAMVKDRPAMGFGLGTWSAAYPGYALFDDGSFVNQAHNDWIQWAVEGGLPLLLMMLGIAAWSIGPAIRTIWGLGMVAVFVHCLVDYPMQQRPALAAFFFAMLGFLAAADRARFRTARRAEVAAARTGSSSV